LDVEVRATKAEILRNKENSATRAVTNLYSSATVHRAAECKCRVDKGMSIEEYIREVEREFDEGGHTVL
jgi:hypothetical protein